MISYLLSNDFHVFEPMKNKRRRKSDMFSDDGVRDIARDGCSQSEREFGQHNIFKLEQKHEIFL